MIHSHAWGRLFALTALLLLMTAPSLRAEKHLRLTFTGDVTLGSEEKLRAEDFSLDTFAAQNGDGYFFDKVRTLFDGDDLTVVNLEGVLSDSSRGENKKKTYRFRGPTAFTSILTAGGIEAVSLANNHTLDYGQSGYNATVDALDAAGISHFGSRSTFVFQKYGLKVGFLSLNTTEVGKSKKWARSEIRRLRQEEGVNAVVFIFHAGQEYNKHRIKAQENHAHFAIDAGADLVIMHHPHVVQGMELYKDRSICYSLGNFCFGGNRNVRAMESLVVAADLLFTDEGDYIGQQLSLYPAHISGTYPKSNYQPHLVTGEDAEKVLSLVQNDTKFTLAPFDEALGCAVQDFLPAK